MNQFKLMHCRSCHFGRYSYILPLFLTLVAFSSFSESINIALASLHFSINAFTIEVAPAGTHSLSVRRVAFNLQTFVHSSANVPLFGLQHSKSRNAT